MGAHRTAKGAPTGAGRILARAGRCAALASIPVLAAVAGCDSVPDPDITELDIHVVVDKESVSLRLREPARPGCTCSSGEIPAVGDCVSDSDGITCTCEPHPASCLETVELRRDGETVEERVVDPTDPIWTGQVFVRDHKGADTIRLVGCGGVATISIPREPFSIPTVTSMEERDNSRLELSWTPSLPRPTSLSPLATASARPSVWRRTPGA